MTAASLRSGNYLSMERGHHGTPWAINGEVII